MGPLHTYTVSGDDSEERKLLENHLEHIRSVQHPPFHVKFLVFKDRFSSSLVMTFARKARHKET